jgi:hypothetical protein
MDRRADHFKEIRSAAVSSSTSRSSLEIVSVMENTRASIGIRMRCGWVEDDTAALRSHNKSWYASHNDRKYFNTRTGSLLSGISARQ